ncbi:MAG: [protein-PII] uridylyltransferase [Pseudomonadota bacterium]
MKRTGTLFELLNDSKHIVRDFLESRERLIQEEVGRYSGIHTTRKYSDLMDRFIKALFFEAGFKKKTRGGDPDALAVMALGGYGRGELCLNSDVDLMLVHRDKLPTEISEIIPRAFYPLWDAKLDVGHSILTAPECTRLAMNDFRVLTSLMDSRFLLGSRAFYRLFQEAFWSRVYRERDSLFNKFLIYQQDREEKYGSEGHFVEPDIKEGLGGLRDLHFMAWIARIFFRCKRLHEIKRFAAFSHLEFDKLSRSRSFLLKLRNHLHLLTERREDRLMLHYQKEISRCLGYEDNPSVFRPEELLTDLYLHLNRIRYRREEFQARVIDMIDPLPLETTPKRLTPELRVIKGNIVLKNGFFSEKDPILILRALKEANQRELFLGSGFIWEARKIIDIEGRRLVKSEAARRLFLQLIEEPKNPKIIRLALELGLISSFIPEFKRIRNLAQFGFYHVTTVDLHSLKTLDVIYQISKGAYDERWRLLREVFMTVKHPLWLFLTALLHDLGKGYGQDHSRKGGELAPRILKRLGIDGGALEAIPFLITHHLLLVNVSQRRDLTDEKTSVHVAQRVQGKDLLNMLFLLTVADSFSTGPLARTDWKVMLLIELFLKVRRILNRGTLATPDATEAVKAKKSSITELLVDQFPEGEILGLIDQISSRYFLSTHLEDMVHHFRMALTLGKKRHSWKIQRLKDIAVTRVIQCTYDQPGLFSKMVGVFTINNMKILSANISTLKNGLAFDIYEVTNPPDRYRELETWDNTLRDLHLALENTLELDSLIREKGQARSYSERYHPPITKNVEVNNEVSDFFTVIEVSSDTRVGLPYELAKEIFWQGLDIRFARVNSDEEKMRGVFYVRNSDGQKVHDKEQIEKIRQGILAVMK